jgi:hypothetical protein
VASRFSNDEQALIGMCRKSSQQRAGC